LSDRPPPPSVTPLNAGALSPTSIIVSKLPISVR
jgi:hypothetical protein